MRFVLILLLALSVWAADRRVAITIDDLPRGGNAGDCPGDLIAMMKRRGYRIVSWTEALKDSLYAVDESFVGDKGISWIHRWGVGKGLPIVWEPGPASMGE